MDAENLSIMPVEMRDLPWISALLQKMVDMTFSRFASQEQLEAIMSKKCTHEAISYEMEDGITYMKLVAGDDIYGLISYKAGGKPEEVYVDKLYALPGEHEAGYITILVNYILEQTRQAGYELLSLFLPPNDQDKLELLTSQGFMLSRLEKIEVCDDFHVDTYVLRTNLKDPGGFPSDSSN